MKVHVWKPDYRYFQQWFHKKWSIIDDTDDDDSSESDRQLLTDPLVQGDPIVDVNDRDFV